MRSKEAVEEAKERDEREEAEEREEMEEEIEGRKPALARGVGEASLPTEEDLIGALAASARLGFRCRTPRIFIKRDGITYAIFFSFRQC